MQIDASRQQVLQAYAKAGQATSRRLSLVGALLMSLAIIQLPCFMLLQLPGLIPSDSFSIFNVAVHHFFYPFNWQPVPGWYPLQIIIYYGVICLVLEIIYIPTAFHSKYTLPRRFALGVRTPRVTLRRIAQKQGMLVARWAVLIEVFYLLFALQPLLWWITMTLIMSIIAFIEQVWGPGKLKRSFTVTPLPEGDLERRLRTLLERSSLPAQEIVVIDKPGEKMAANAYIVGLGKRRLIGISSTILKEFPSDEVEVFVAHELGHYAHHDLLRKSAVRAGIRLMWYGIMALFLSGGVVAFPAISHGIADVSTVPFFLMMHLMFWNYGKFSFSKFSRRCEYEADEFALQTTGLVTAFQQGMVRMTNINRTIANHKGNHATHPTIMSRIQHADEFAIRNKVLRNGII